MPLFEFLCPAGHVTELLRSYERRDEPVPCRCGRTTRRLFPLPHIEPDGIYSYEPNIGREEDFERKVGG